MSIAAIANSLGTQSLTRQLAVNVDSNQDGQISTQEFGDFIAKLFPNGSGSATSSSAGSAPDDTPALDFTPLFKGFDASRSVSAAGSLKYDAYNVLQNYDPKDPTAMKSAYAVLSAMHPGQYELDGQDNLMLTGTADGYIGGRPFNRESDWTNRAQDWSWDWMGYNVAHPGPNGEGLAAGASPV
jgi:hypothetical protein